MDEATSFLVIGLGNEFRGDDGCGPLAARLIDRKEFAGIRLICPVADSTDMVMEWDGTDTVFVIDCVQSDVPPGTIHRFEPLLDEIPESLFQPTSTHRFGITQIVRLAQALGRLPHRLIVYGIEGARFNHGTDMTPAVAQASRDVARRIASEMVELTSLASHGGESRL